MEISGFLDTAQDVKITFNQGQISLSVYDESHGWTEYEISASELTRFLTVVEVARG